MTWAAGTTSPADSLLQYGLAGVIVISFVVPLALYIKKQWEKRESYLEAEIVRLRGENADLRRVLDPLAPTLTGLASAVNNAINIISSRGNQ